MRCIDAEIRRQPNAAFARVTTRLWLLHGLLPNSLDRKIKYSACTACAVNVTRIENIRPASLSLTEYSTSLKVTRRLPDGKAPKGTIRLKEDRVFVVDDQLFYLWEEKIGRPRVDITDTG